MRVLVLLSALCFALPSLINMFGFGTHEIGLVETARAQTFANELAEVLDDGDNLRVLPIVTTAPLPISMICCICEMSTSR